MALPRVQLFEFNDLPWVGADLRDTIVESLGRGLSWGRTLAGLVDPFEEFLERAGTRRLLDLCAGSGSPAEILVGELARCGRDVPEVVLTDLYPRPHAWRRIAAREPTIAWHPDPVDATRVPEALGEGRARVIINAFHHFPPALATSILRGAVAQRAALWISEPFERQPRGFLSFAPFGLAALLANPVLTPERTLKKALYAWGITPVTLAISAWDGFISTLRVYTEGELRQMVAPFGQDYAWHYGTYRYALGGEGYYFYGLPAEA